MPACAGMTRKKAANASGRPVSLSRRSQRRRRILRLVYCEASIRLIPLSIVNVISDRQCLLVAPKPKMILEPLVLDPCGVIHELYSPSTNVMPAGQCLLVAPKLRRSLGGSSDYWYGGMLPFDPLTIIVSGPALGDLNRIQGGALT